MSHKYKFFCQTETSTVIRSPYWQNFYWKKLNNMSGKYGKLFMCKNKYQKQWHRRYIYLTDPV